MTNTWTDSKRHWLKRMSRFRNCLLVGLCLTVSSCSLLPRYLRYAEPPPPPPPPPSCAALPAPVRALEMSRPTSPGFSPWLMERVQGASTPAQEYALQPLSSTTAIVLLGQTARDGRATGFDNLNPTQVRQSRPSDTISTALPFLTTIQQSGRIMGDASIHKADVSLADVHIDSTALIDEAVAWDGHPALSADGRWIVFASDRTGTQGGADLWYAPYLSTSVGRIRALHGANTPCDELSPSWTPQGRLLFSSAGHTSYGGYDIHEAQVVQEADSLRVVSVTNTGTPINSSADEIFPVMMPDSTFYVASTRSAGRDASRRDFDIWVLHRTSVSVPEPPAVVAAEDPFSAGQATYTGKVINTTTQQPVIDAEVIARLPQSTEVLSRARTDASGTYSLRVPVERQVEITAQDRELFFDNIVTVIPASERNRVVESTQPLGLSSTFVLRVNFPTSVFDRPYPNSLDSNGTELERSWTRDVQDLVANVKSSGGTIRKIILTGHTDDVDSDADNLELGRKRVEFIIDRLVEGGLPRELFEGRTRGERDLLERRQGESAETWRKRCRRVELIKVQ